MITIKNISYLTEIGQRPQLEDSIYPLPGEATESDKLFIICDGVGGENMGEVASKIACEEFAFYFKQKPPNADGFTQDYIKAAQQFVLQKMIDYADKNNEAAKMSTTLALVYIGNNTVSAAWCGDSRIYHIRNGKVVWRSTDHSLVANMVKHGEITQEEADVHPRRNVITRSLSAYGNPSVIDVYPIKEVVDKDYLMLCTDGVLEQINEARLSAILLNDIEDKESLFKTYSQGKTKDNFSLYLLQLHTDGDGLVSAKGGKKGSLVIPLISLLAVILIAGGVIGKYWGGAGGETEKSTVKKDSLAQKPADSAAAAAKGTDTSKVAEKDSSAPYAQPATDAIKQHTHQLKIKVKVGNGISVDISTTPPLTVNPSKNKADTVTDSSKKKGIDTTKKVGDPSQGKIDTLKNQDSPITDNKQRVQTKPRF